MQIILCLALCNNNILSKKKKKKPPHLFVLQQSNMGKNNVLHYFEARSCKCNLKRFYKSSK